MSKTDELRRLAGAFPHVTVSSDTLLPLLDVVDAANRYRDFRGSSTWKGLTDALDRVEATKPVCAAPAACRGRYGCVCDRVGPRAHRPECPTNSAQYRAGEDDPILECDCDARVEEE